MCRQSFATEVLSFLSFLKSRAVSLYLSATFAASPHAISQVASSMLQILGWTKHTDSGMCQQTLCSASPSTAAAAASASFGSHINRSDQVGLLSLKKAVL